MAGAGANIDPFDPLQCGFPILPGYQVRREREGCQWREKDRFVRRELFPHFLEVFQTVLGVEDQPKRQQPGLSGSIGIELTEHFHQHTCRLAVLLLEQRPGAIKCQARKIVWMGQVDSNETKTFVFTKKFQGRIEARFRPPFGFRTALQLVFL